MLFVTPLTAFTYHRWYKHFPNYFLNELSIKVQYLRGGRTGEAGGATATQRYFAANYLKALTRACSR